MINWMTPRYPKVIYNVAYHNMNKSDDSIIDNFIDNFSYNV